MDIQAEGVYRAMLSQLKADIAEAEPHARARALVDFANFVLSDAASDGAAAVKELFGRDWTEPWDEAWVVPELARATLDALSAWQSIATAVLERLNNSDDTETTRELRNRLTKVLKTADRRLMPRLVA